MKISHYIIPSDKEIHVHQYNLLNRMSFFGFPKNYETIDSEYLIGKWHVKHKRNDR